MTQRKNTKRALLASVLSIVLCAAMLVGLTFAWFTDGVSTVNNKIVAGNLDVALYNVDGDVETEVTENTNLFDSGSLWEPGHVEVVNLKIANLGSLALTYQFAINVASEKGSVNVYGNEFKLSDYIKFAVIEGNQSYESRDAAITAAEEAGSVPISQLNVNDENVLYPEGSSDGISEKYVTLVVYMPTSVGNDANYMTADNVSAPEINLGVTLAATQTPYESDSFNEYYDEELDYPIMSSDEAKDSLVDNSTSDIVIDSDITITSEDNVRISSDKTIDFSNNTVERTSAGGNGIVVGQTTGYATTPVNVIMKNGNFVADEGVSSPVVRVESGSTATFVNCTFDGRNPFQSYASDDADGQVTTLVFEKCIFNGMVDLSTASGGGREYDVTFVDCVFTGTFGNGEAAVDIDANAYGSVVMENCDINITYTGNAVTGVRMGSYYGSNGDNTMTLTLIDTDITVTKDASATREPTVSDPVYRNTPTRDNNTLVIEGDCTFIRNGQTATYDAVTKEWSYA